MSAPLKWHVLPLDPSSSLPILLVAMNTGASSYQVYVTDLANIWVESLDRKAIIKRGWDEDLSIDPSDTPENMITFLSSIKSALDPGTAPDESNHIVLSPGADKESGENGLRLDITCELPGFEPLKWPLHLKKAPASALATNFVLPLIEAQHASDRQVNSLIQALQHKDAVLTKLVDKLAATGTTLDQVFNVLSGRKNISRTAAEDRVKGLTPFSRGKWARSLQGDVDGEVITHTDLVHKVFAVDGLQYPGAVDLGESSVLDGWWRHFQPRSKIPEKTSTRTSAAIPKPKPATELRQSVVQDNKDDYDDDDDFQVQATPPKKKEKEKQQLPAKGKTLAEDDSTADEDDAEDVRPSSTETGTVGDGKQSTSRASIATHKTPNPEDEGDETASEPEEDDQVRQKGPDETVSLPDSSPSPPPPPIRTGKPSSSIGKIGGAPKIGQVGRLSTEPVPQHRRGLAEPKPEPEHADNDDSEIGDHNDGARPNVLAGTSAPAPRKIGVIGKIGGGAAARGRTVVAEETPVKRETSQERVERKREEMRRELEKKATGPSKKKRKF